MDSMGSTMATEVATVAIELSADAGGRLRQIGRSPMAVIGKANDEAWHCA
jgi:hypothetical protein